MTTIAQVASASRMEFKEHRGQEEHEGLDANIEGIARAVVDAGLKVHRSLGPGLLDSAYESCFARELELRRIPFQRQKPRPVSYEGVVLENAYRLDLIVADAIILEIKAVEAITRLHEAQLLTYLRLSKRRIGFLMNFNVVLFKQGLRRLAF